MLIRTGMSPFSYTCTPSFSHWAYFLFSEYTNENKTKISAQAIVSGTKWCGSSSNERGYLECMLHVDTYVTSRKLKIKVAAVPLQFWRRINDEWLVEITPESSVLNVVIYSSANSYIMVHTVSKWKFGLLFPLPCFLLIFVRYPDINCSRRMYLC